MRCGPWPHAAERRAARSQDSALLLDDLHRAVRGVGRAAAAHSHGKLVLTGLELLADLQGAGPAGAGEALLEARHLAVPRRGDEVGAAGLRLELHLKALALLRLRRRGGDVRHLRLAAHVVSAAPLAARLMPIRG